MTGILLAALIAFVGTAVFRNAVGWGFAARPNSDVPSHMSTVPLLGGVAIMLALVPCLAEQAMRDRSYRGLAVSVSIVALLGLYKDRVQRPVSPLAQMAIQALAVAVLLVVDAPITMSGSAKLDAVGSVILGVLMINAWNFLDVTDGLAGGVAVVTSACAGAIAMSTRQPQLMVFCLALSAAVLGFLFHNVPPARIFMGDVGSFGLGVLFFYLLLRLSAGAGLNAPWILGALFVLPVLEMAFTVSVRGITGHSPLKGNAQHLSLLLLRRGWRPWSVVLLACSVALLGGVISVCLSASV